MHRSGRDLPREVRARGGERLGSRMPYAHDRLGEGSDDSSEDDDVETPRPEPMLPRIRARRSGEGAWSRHRGTPWDSLESVDTR